MSLLITLRNVIFFLFDSNISSFVFTENLLADVIDTIACALNRSVDNPAVVLESFVRGFSMIIFLTNANLVEFPVRIGLSLVRDGVVLCDRMISAGCMQ